MPGNEAEMRKNRTKKIFVMVFLLVMVAFLVGALTRNLEDQRLV